MLLAHELHGPVEAGTKQLVLIHGITESRHSWRPIINRLSESYRVLAVDLRGHGESAHGEAYDPISYAGDVVETMASVGVAKPVVLGHSLGGVVASAVAALGGASAVLNVDQPLRLASFKEGLSMLEPMLRGDEALFQAGIAAMFSMMDGELPASERARISAHGRADQAVVFGTWASVLESTPEELDATVATLASAVTVPYLSLHGIDPGPEYSPWLTCLIPSATVEVWAGLGHYPHLVDADRFISRLETFCATV
jgi:pimeloyl-ACP methyl ester carboxylesterase